MTETIRLILLAALAAPTAALCAPTPNPQPPPGAASNQFALPTDFKAPADAQGAAKPVATAVQRMDQGGSDHSKPAPGQIVSKPTCEQAHTCPPPK